MTVESPRQTPVPYRTILAVIGLVLATVGLLYVLAQVTTVLTWILVASFLAVALNPLVGGLEARVPRRSRALATLLVFITVILVLGGVVAAFAVPLAEQGARFAAALPDLIEQARTGRGAVGSLLERVHVLQFVQDNQERIRSYAAGLTTPAAGLLRGVATGVAGVVSITVLAYLMVLQGPRVVGGAIGLLPELHRERARLVVHDCAGAVTGYISGNLLISLICGGLTYVVLIILGVPFAGLLALFVGIADLIPLVGATIGAVAVIAVAVIHSLAAAIVVLVFFVVYQQVENHLLQPLIFSRTVQLDPLTVLIAVLVGAELGGILAALLAIPVTGMGRTVIQDLRRYRGADPEPGAGAGPDATPAGAEPDQAEPPGVA